MNNIRSMTGFGVASVEKEGLFARVEIRCVNHRGLKLSIRSRPSLGVLEKKLRDLVTGRLIRGTIDVFVYLNRPIDAESLSIQTGRARSTVTSLQAIAEQLELPGQLSAADLLHIPGLFDEFAGSPVTEEEWPVVAEATETALKQAVEMREAEGEALSENLLEHTQPIRAFAEEARKLAPVVIERFQERLTVRIDELRKGNQVHGDTAAIEREVCIFADRADIHEELDRLGSHLNQYTLTIEKGGEAGKRLEFLAQEFLREVNTCASKASDTMIVQYAMEAKIAIEKIKEQAANIE